MFTDRAPEQSPVSVDVVGGQFFRISATGSVNNDPFPSGLSPDGGGDISHASENGVGSLTAPINSLIGVFRGIPSGGSSSGPALNQPFFIGSARTVQAPPGAERLFLGSMDGYDWNNNFGSFLVTVEPSNFVPIPMGSAPNTRLADMNPAYPSGSGTILGGVPFDIPATGNNVYATEIASGGSPGTVTLAVPTDLVGVSKVHFIINTFWGETVPGTFASLTFNYADGSALTAILDGDSDIRDWVNNVWANNINNTTTVNVFSTDVDGSAGPNPYRLDKLAVDVSSHQSKRLTSIVLQDFGSSGFQRVFLAGITAELRGTSARRIEFTDSIPANVRPVVRLREPYRLDADVRHYQGVVTVKDQNGLPQRVSVRFWIAGNHSEAGHDASYHTPDSVHGWLYKDGDIGVDDDGLPLNKTTKLSQAALGGSNQPDGYFGGTELIIDTEANGEARFGYVPAEVSGTDTITAEIVENGGVKESERAQKTVEVFVPGLVDMKALFNSGFRFFGVTDAHPRNWFATSSTVAALSAANLAYVAAQTSDTTIAAAVEVLDKLGYDWINEFPSGRNPGGIITPKDPELISVNDMSLPKGGLFDAVSPGTFASPHGGHREGKHCDIKSVHLVSGMPYVLTATTWDYPQFKNAVGDSRLESAQWPFRDEDSYVGANGKPTFYTDQIRKRMDHQVKIIHYRRLQLLLDALYGQGGDFAPESNHIHVAF